MCRRVSCGKCGKPTWAGCGAHVEQVLGNVPKDERCRCRDDKPAAAGPSELLRKGVLLVGVALVGWFVLFNGAGDTSGTEARALVEAGAQLVDVRTPAEFAAGHVPGAVNIPVEELENRIAEVPGDRPIVVYCRSGNRSGKAKEILEEAGRTRVHDLGAMSSW